MNIAAILPARGGSRRLPRKNLAPLMGKPMMAWVIDAVRDSRHLGVDKLWVSTDDPEIAAEARARGAGVVLRGPDLSGDAVWTEPVIQHAVEEIEAELGPRLDLVVWLNASVPEILGTDIDRAIEWLVRDRLREVISVGADERTHSGVRVLTREALFQRRLTVHAGVMRLPYMDVHTAEDLARLRRRLELRFAWQAAEGDDAPPIPKDIDWELDGEDWSSDAFMSVTDTALVEGMLRRRASAGFIDVLEWGSGLSTLHFSRKLRDWGASFRWLALEHDRSFFDATIAPNLEDVPDAWIYASGGPQDDGGRASRAQRLELVVFDSGVLRPYLASGIADRSADLDDYVALPAKTGRRFNLILVDGRKRRRCLLEAIELLAPDGVVLLHDAWRPYYRCAFGSYPHHKRFGDILWAGALDARALDTWVGTCQNSPDWLPS
jgi:CTP:molybdopterin cytidylyltransferase MocA